ncbi:hypothetical protein J2Z79_001771 [Symbiobacterium terraclitae]|uniref:Uncharacterized protein n=1 Tax=Symbiobacterium terraclitae TaxID=557451 RepID=A0ABS4JS75_9FIRM|nr:hypothetical protein [Symbiobacterium terraclitae]MBP2018363.1 hypothetical protein [Symbiobacterium terraclitae]
MAKRNHEPEAVKTTLTGTHAAGHHLNEAAEFGRAAAVSTDDLAWIEREDQAKQSMARTGDMRSAQAAPDRPHPAGHPETGGRQ